MAERQLTHLDPRRSCKSLYLEQDTLAVIFDPSHCAVQGIVWRRGRIWKQAHTVSCIEVWVSHGSIGVLQVALKELNAFDVHNNLLTRIPSSLFTLPWLQFVYLGNNRCAVHCSCAAFAFAFFVQWCPTLQRSRLLRDCYSDHSSNETSLHA